MIRVFITHNLPPGISFQDYEDYANRVFLPTIRSFPSVCSFNLYRALGAPPGTAPYAYVGVLDVNSIDDYQADRQTAHYGALEKDWQSRVVDVTTVVGEAVG